MAALNRKNLFSPQLFFLSAGLLLRAHCAFANDPSNDAQAQARALLNPPVVHHVIAAQGASSPTNDRTLVGPDAQESARAFLSGKSITDDAARSATANLTQKERQGAASNQSSRVSVDPQEAMRRMILGVRAASAVVHSDGTTREALAVRD